MTHPSSQPERSAIRSTDGADSPHLGPVEEQAGRRARMGRDELAIVLSRYEIGAIRRLRDYPRGSRRAPKLRIDADLGELLLKRRAQGRDEPERLVFNTALHRLLDDHAFPVAPIVPTRSDHGLALRVGGHAYELFHYVRGIRDDRTEEAARESGRMLGRLHRLIADMQPASLPRQSSFHAAQDIPGALDRVPAVVRRAEPGADAEPLIETCRLLRGAYLNAVRRVRDTGHDEAPSQPIHGDWHPGNLLYRDGRIVAVLDFDSARMEPRVVDVANAALQFGMIAGDADDPRRWPDRLDARRIRALAAGYDGEARTPLSEAERLALPWLLIEALIVESVVPIAARGRFGHLSGAAFLQMVASKIHWIVPRADRLSRLLAE